MNKAIRKLAKPIKNSKTNLLQFPAGPCFCFIMPFSLLESDRFPSRIEHLLGSSTFENLFAYPSPQCAMCADRNTGPYLRHPAGRASAFGRLSPDLRPRVDVQEDDRAKSSRSLGTHPSQVVLTRRIVPGGVYGCLPISFRSRKCSSMLHRPRP